MFSKLWQFEQMFCMCDYEHLQAQVYQFYQPIIGCQQQNMIVQPLQVPDMDMEKTKVTQKQKIQRKKKKLMVQNKDLLKECDRLESLWYELPYEKIILEGKSKASRCADNSFRRSMYIGVSRNGPNWQALISINRRKTYIGTFTTQLEAARAFDKYSIILNNLTAITNFNYTKKELVELISEYRKEHEEATDSLNLNESRCM